jgi:protein SCO1/2
VARPWFWVVFLLLAFSWPFVRAVVMSDELPPPPPVLGHVPPFRLTDQHGRPFGDENLRGRAWVAGFMFTRCPSICPALTERMLGIHRRTKNLDESFLLVSFTVDPEHDTPEVLLEYAKQRQIRLSRWTFLTGPRDEIRRVVQEGMKVLVGDAAPGVAPESIAHGTHLVLVDQEMRIRGYYDSADPARIEELLEQIGLLANRGPRTE